MEYILTSIQLKDTLVNLCMNNSAAHKGYLIDHMEVSSSWFVYEAGKS